MYGCQRHEVDLPVGEKPVWKLESDAGGEGARKGEDVTPLRAGFLLGDGAGMGKGRTLAGFCVENIARGRNKHVWVR